MLAGCAAHSSPAGPSAAPFIVTFWCAPPLAEFDDARAAEIAAAGFTTVGAPCEGGFDPQQNQRALATAARHGLRLWVADHRYGPGAIENPLWQELIADAVADYGSAPALGGYFIVDEPPATQFEAVAAVTAALRAADPDRLAYVNLLPSYIPPEALGAASYEDYLERFVEIVQPTLLSYDNYPFGKEKDRSSFFTNLETVRAVALRHGLPFMLIVLAMPHGPYRDPTEAELAWQVFHALAYGARGISYFAYWTPPSDEDWQNRNGLLEDGRPTLHYFQAARLNQIVRALGAELTGFRSLAVADALGEVAAPLPIGPLEAIDGGPVTAGLFGDGTGRIAVLLVNRDYRYGVTAQVRRRPGVPPPAIFDPATRAWRSAGDAPITLAPGDARLLRWEAES
ncbi:MAG: hypothetical protein ACRERC_11665 [Candidatus Binatia bacterium]